MKSSVALSDKDWFEHDSHYFYSLVAMGIVYDVICVISVNLNFWIPSVVGLSFRSVVLISFRAIGASLILRNSKVVRYGKHFNGSLALLINHYSSFRISCSEYNSIIIIILFRLVLFILLYLVFSKFSRVQNYFFSLNELCISPRHHASWRHRALITSRWRHRWLYDHGFNLPIVTSSPALLASSLWRHFPLVQSS